MTAVLSLKFYNFVNNNNNNGERGILSGCLSALSKHNLRQEINRKMEIKRKQKTNINEAESKNNIVVQSLDYEEIDRIKQLQKDTKTRKNGVGAFSLVFDFKNQDKEQFDIKAHNELINEYLADIGLSDRFEQLEFVWHMDEKSVHCHVLFSGYDRYKARFVVNDYFSPKGEPEPKRNKKGNVIFKKIANGKDRGKFQLDNNGKQIPKLEAKRRNGAQWLQDTFSEYLDCNNLIYTNKKEFSSLLQFSNSVWRGFSDETKEAVYHFRKLEDEFYELKQHSPKHKLLKQLHQEMVTGVSEILIEARDIQEKNKKLSNRGTKK